MAININGAKKVFASKQTLVVYQQGNAPTYRSVSKILAPSTDATLPLYSAGRILATYGADAPSPDLIGCAVNWDPTSAIASQKIATHILSDEFVHDVTGIDITSTLTMTETINRVACTPLGINLSLYYSAIALNNTAAVVTAFNTSFATINLGDTSNTNTADKVISIQKNSFIGVNGATVTNNKLTKGI